MKFESEPKDNIEISVKKQQEKRYELIKSIVPHLGHTLYEINKETLEIRKAKFASITGNYVFGEKNNKELIIQKGFAYVSALNEKNALKKYLKGRNGSITN